MRSIKTLNYKYLLTQAASIIVRPAFLYLLMAGGREEAEFFAQLLILNQLILYCTGTQIHKDFLGEKQIDRSRFRSSSFLEGLMIGPLACLLLIFFSDLQSIEGVVFVLCTTPLEKLIDDYQRELSYMNSNLRMAIVLLARNCILPASIAGCIWLDIASENALIISALLLTIYLSFIGVLPRLVGLANLDLIVAVTRRLSAVGAIGIVWSLCSGLVLQYDKLIVTQLEGEVAGYLFRYQILLVGFTAYTILTFIPNRHLVLDDRLAFKKSVQPMLYLYAAAIMAVSIIAETVGLHFGLVPTIGWYLTAMQPAILIIAMLSHYLVEITFWQFRLEQIALAEVLGFILVAGVSVSAVFYGQGTLPVLGCLFAALVVRFCALSFFCRNSKIA